MKISSRLDNSLQNLVLKSGSAHEFLKLLQKNYGKQLPGNLPTSGKTHDSDSIRRRGSFLHKLYASAPPDLRKTILKMAKPSPITDGDLDSILFPPRPIPILSAAQKLALRLARPGPTTTSESDYLDFFKLIHQTLPPLPADRAAAVLEFQQKQTPQMLESRAQKMTPAAQEEIQKLLRQQIQAETITIPDLENVRSRLKRTIRKYNLHKTILYQIQDLDRSVELEPLRANRYPVVASSFPIVAAAGVAGLAAGAGAALAGYRFYRKRSGSQQDETDEDKNEADPSDSADVYSGLSGSSDATPPVATVVE